MNRSAYLQRIGADASVPLSHALLKNLQLAHLYTVPFENFSIHREEPITLTTEALFEKVVTRNRGGFCFELNGLFAALLRDVGFTVDMISARVWQAKEQEYTPDFDHMTLLVTIEEERWLVDVGFGDTFREPLSLDRDGEQAHFGRFYRFLPTDNDLILQEKKGDDQPWKNHYRFRLQPYQFDDYAHRCRFHQTDPSSGFRQSQLATLATPDGRITLSDRLFITTSRDGTRTEETIEDDAAYQTLLWERFGLRFQ